MSSYKLECRGCKAFTDDCFSLDDYAGVYFCSVCLRSLENTARINGFPFYYEWDRRPNHVPLTLEEVSEAVRRVEYTTWKAAALLRTTVDRLYRFLNQDRCRELLDMVLAHEHKGLTVRREGRDWYFTMTGIPAGEYSLESAIEATGRGMTVAVRYRGDKAELIRKARSNMRDLETGDRTAKENSK